MLKKVSSLVLVLIFLSLFFQSLQALELTVSVTNNLNLKSSVYNNTPIPIGDPIREFGQNKFVPEKVLYQILSEAKKGRANKFIEESGYSDADIERLIAFLGVGSIDKGTRVYFLIEKIEFTDIGIAEIKDAVVLAYSLDTRKKRNQIYTIGFEKYRSSVKSDEQWKVGNFRNQVLYRKLFFEGEINCIQYFKKSDPSQQLFENC